MNNYFLKFFKSSWQLVILFIYLQTTSAVAQISVTTTNSFLNNNGSGTVTFNLHNSNNYPIIIQEFHGVIGATITATVQVYYNTTPLGGAPTAFTVVNGWNLVGSGSVSATANTTTTATIPLLTGLNFIMPANTTYALAVFGTSQRYSTHPGGTTIDSAGGVRIITGTSIGYGGNTPPTAPTISPRGWIGTIKFIPAVPCSGTPYPGTAITNKGVVCSAQNFNLGLADDSIRMNLSYQWLSSPSGLPNTYSVLSNDTLRNITKSQTATNWYRCLVSCGSNSDTSDEVIVTTPTGSLSGNYTVNPATTLSATNFHSLNDLVTAMNCNGVTGPVNINIPQGVGTLTANINFGNITGTSATNLITINGHGNTITSASSPIVTFGGSKFIVWDSLNVVAASNYAGFGIHIGGASESITISNSTINVGTISTATSNAAIVVSGSQSAVTTVGNNGKNLTIQNNQIIGGYYSIALIGTASYLNNSGNRIINNSISDFYLYGIYMTNSDTTYIENNDISRLNRTVFTTFYGIYGATTRNSKIRNNKIHDSGPGSYTAYPMYFTTMANNAGYETEITNNLIYNINTTGTFYGMYFLTSFVNAKIYHNTIDHNSSGGTGAKRNLFISTAPSNLDVRNNIFSINGNGTSIKYNVYITTASATYNSNRNVMYMGATAGTNYAGYWGANAVTLSNWQTLSSIDTNSVNSDPVYTSVAAGNLIPISNNIDNLGTPVGITTDINGVSRSLTQPDAGSYEFTGISGDLKIDNAILSRSSQCYSTADTLKMSISNLIGSTVNFSINPTTIVYEITGPINTTDSIVLSTDTLGMNAMITRVRLVNLSIPGIYYVTGYIRPNGINNISSNDTLISPSMIEVKPIISVTPKTGTANTPTDTFVLRANSPIFPAGGAKFTEICHFRGATNGAPVGGWPTYLTADDYVEITGVANSDLAGYTMEEWNGTALQHTVTFASGTLFSPSGILIIATGQLGASSPSPSNFYYHSGNTFTHGSTGIGGYIIKNASGTIIDATTYGAYTFPALAGVSTNDWSGSTPAVSSPGNRLAGPDNNLGADWISSSALVPQDPGVLNTNVPSPVPSSMVGFNWYYLGSPIDTNAQITVGPYTTPGVYTYVARYVTACGTFTDTVRITASNTVPVIMNKFDAVKIGSVIQLNWQTASEINNAYFNIERSFDNQNFEAIGRVKGNGNSNRIINYEYNDFDAAEMFSSQKQLYYHLKQVDFDGKFEYSKTAVVQLNELNTIEPVVIPNPNNGEFNIQLQGIQSEQQVSIEIYDIMGKSVYESKLLMGKEINQMSISKQLPAGMYTAVIQMADTKHAVKVMIK
ncbi:MAG: T9SS type A sorting domain-containing protein [bacterium]|nr:T9SS type A sorting domain-containing protein [bacterium]